MKKISLYLQLLSLSILLAACDTKAPVAIEAVDTSSNIQALAKGFSAHWLTPQIILLPKQQTNNRYQLTKLAANTVDTVALTATTLPKKLAEKFPHLTGFQSYKVNISNELAKQWLKHSLVITSLDADKQLIAATYIQTGAVIDALYTSVDNDADEVTDLGANISEQGVSFKLWAPTAQAVSVLLFDENLQAMPNAQLAMIEDSKTGVWQVTTGDEASYAYYQYQVRVYHPASKKVETLQVTDPYSLSLSVNSEYSQVVNLNDATTQPSHWAEHSIPRVKNIEDNIFYETHIRDFSANDPSLTNPKFKGKYKAFSEENSDGMQHLKALQASGLNNIHLLPTYDIATVNEEASQHIDMADSLAKVCTIAAKASICQQDYNEQQTLKSLLSSYATDGKKAQQLVSELRAVDNYNWGYDPLHYTVPEGSYAVNAQGVARLVEFREMVQNLHELGFRVIMDVVYNHTYASGLDPKSVLDKIVPNYYHRLDPLTGAIEQSTCCDNTATERVMMEKLMIDSLVIWARDYKIDGFRFDLMGHQPKSAMLKAREAVRSVDSDTYFYGEGWNFGEVANNNQFVQASQLELGGSEIGTFSDRLRDAVRGGGNNTRATQGIGNGLLMQANELQTTAQSQASYELLMNQLRIGLAGNLADFPITDKQGRPLLGKDVPYGDQPTGYAKDPADTINYVSKHDNQTLWDNSQYRLAFDVSTQDRVRMHLQSLSFALFAQGIPFVHMGSEFMRSKSFLRDSYDYGDWFNRVDFSAQENYYDVGLPPAEKDQANWPLIQQVLLGHEGRDKVDAEDIAFSNQVFQQMLAIRMSTPLFRLTTAQEIIEQVSFLNIAGASQDGLLVMQIKSGATQENSTLDDKHNYQSVIVIFNISPKTQRFSYSGASTYILHPLQQAGIDEQVKASKISADEFEVPALSSAVFVSLKALH
ncbi:pullulanase-type alpha-1,6-glucosidase [Colwellia sp. D2M02]|uniref:pullulanase-type alpha-1,6-glucosidase n=1 Tax=Colwellia sp. D2M02 TaxID=2841562 RepID=UPI001C093782|nr:pullulanase-type alpha-1,6-glucosidase [Colwellia sp. D2M02]MBU2893703.1 pullulanase-type alpha-1,6-glucosidase [Colwellia sp. D2M02]